MHRSPSRDTSAGYVQRAERRLRVLFLTGWYPTVQNPVAGVFIRELAHAVAQHHDVAVLHCQGPDPECRGSWDFQRERTESVTEGIPAWRVSVRTTRIPGLQYSLHVRAIARAFRHIRAAGFRPDLIHAHSYEPGLPAVLLGMMYRIPVVVSEHYSGFAQGTLSRRELAKARWAFARAARVLPVSHALQQVLEGYGLRARFHVVPNVVNREVFRPGRRSMRGTGRRLLFVGRLVPIKNVTALIRAVAPLSESARDWHLDIVGDGPLREECERLVAMLGIAGRVTFHGSRPKSEIAAFMRNADTFVLPSLWDNNPCVLIEALASGLPIVATRTGGIPEIVDDSVGILIPPGDEVALSAAIARMLDVPPVLDPATLSRKAEIFGRDSIGETCSNIYRRCFAP